MVGSFRNLTFLPVIIANILIGIVQEIRAKKVLEELTMLNAPHAFVQNIPLLFLTETNQFLTILNAYEILCRLFFFYPLANGHTPPP